MPFYVVSATNGELVACGLFGRKFDSVGFLKYLLCGQNHDRYFKDLKKEVKRKFGEK